jgi:hypothetical protein
LKLPMRLRFTFRRNVLGEAARDPKRAASGSNVVRCEVSLLDHLIGGRQQRFRDRDAERLGGLEVDHQFELGSPLDRQIGWLSAFENAPGIDACLMVANDPQQSWGFGGEPPEAVMKDSGTRDGTL